MEFFGLENVLAMARRGDGWRNLFDSVRKNKSKETLFGPQKKYYLFFIKKTQF